MKKTGSSVGSAFTALELPGTVGVPECAGSPDEPADIGGRCLCYNLRRVSRAVTRHYDQCLAPAGLRTTQFSLLQAIRRLGPVTVSDLAEVALTERTTLTRNLGVLERDGLIATQTGKTGMDRRKRLLALTDAGCAALNRAYPHWEAAQRSMEDRLGAGRLGQLLGDLANAAEGAVAELVTTEENGKRDGRD